MIELHNETPVYEKEVHFNEDKNEKVFVMVNNFRGTEYLHIRKYYMDFDEEWKPSSEGIAMPLDFDNSRNLFVGLVEILSLAESKEIIEEHFGELIKDLYSK